MNPSQYDYNISGFDDFLSRGIDDTAMVSLNSPGPMSNQVAYDRTQVTGQLGDTLQIGNVRIEKQAIIISDGENDFFLAGDDET